MSEEERDDEGEIEQKSVDELVRALDKAENGSYAFLIGAGVSRPSPAEIPTAGELIAEFKEDRFEDVDSDQSLEDWAEEYQNVPEDKAYGFWFSEVHPTPGNRRERIKDMVEGEVEPPFGQIVLASMMDDGIISHTFTPNFDDLLFDAFYDFSEHRPLFVDHEAKAKQFIMSGDQPAIVKLHGDYLHYTQNTAGETAELDTNIKDRFQQSLGEYGMIVVGYGGRDDSIMNVLEAEESFSEYGLFWCVRGEDKVPERVKELLADSENAYLVEIEGAESLFKTLWTEIERVELPQPDEIMKQAEERRDRIKKRKAEIEEGEGIEDPESLVWDGVDLRTEGEYEAAIDVLSNVIQNHPKMAEAYFQRAIALEKIGKYESALEDYNRTLELNPEYTDALNNRGNVKRELGEYESAIEDYNRSLELDPGRVIELNNRGIAKRKLGEYESAIEDYDRALELDPEYIKALYNRGIANRELGEYEAAIDDYDRALELDPEHIHSLNIRGNVKRDLGEYESAIEDYDRALELDPHYWAAYINRSEANIQIGNYERARDDAQSAFPLAETTDHEAQSILLDAISAIMLDQDAAEMVEKYRNICQEEFRTSWSFRELDSWLEDAEIEVEKQERIAELIDMLREHKDE